MAVNKISIEEFLLLSKKYPVLDVRSPGEYTHAHMQGAISLPLFNDEERAKVGTAYKQQSRENAIKIGLDFFGPNMRGMVEKVEGIISSWKGIVGKGNLSKGKEKVGDEPSEKIPSINDLDYPMQIANCVLLHCWRGGMRSAAVAWLLDLYGFKVYILIDGYKGYRNWVLNQFTKEYNFKIIGGYTGSGKTLLLHALAKEKNSIVDLEGLANHKGSALGALGNLPQPTQEMFENLLATELHKQSSIEIESELGNSSRNSVVTTANCIWLEDESQRIGNLQIPMPLWYCMRKAPVFFVDIPFEERLNYLTDEYGVHDKTGLVNAIIRIQKRLGGLETKNAINNLLENNFKESFRILLHYYDKWYAKGLYNRENAEYIVKKIPAKLVNTEQNIKLIKMNNN